MSTELTVTRTEQITPHLRRLWFHSPDLSAFAASDRTDRYVKLVFPQPGVTYPHFDVRRLRSEMSAEDLPAIRTYTALWPDVEAGTLAIEFVVHGTDGIAGPWAQQAQVGDTLLANGPGGGYRPDPDADWHLMVGDESAIPAIRSALADLAEQPAAVVEVLLLVEDAAGETPLGPLPAGTQLTWLHRHVHGDAPEVLRDAVAALAWHPGRVQVFAHGEAEQIMKQVRPYLLQERAVPRADASISAYWRRGATEEGFRAWKSAQPSD